MAAQAKQTAKKDTETVRTSTASDAASGQPDRPAATTQQRTQQTRPAPSARSGIRVSGELIRDAVELGRSSRAVKAIQYALADRGFDPGTRSGYYDQATKDAYVKYQRSIGEDATGEPTDSSLDYLGFDVI